MQDGQIAGREDEALVVEFTMQLAAQKSEMVNSEL
jgi:hypothetical protein